MNIRQFLETHNIPFKTIVHPPAFDASHLAEATHTSGKQVAKTVLLHVNHSFRDVVAIVPATAQVDLRKVGEIFGGAEVRLANEKDVASRCPDCETGVLPPFGSQYGMRTVVDESLAHDQIVFEANTHNEAIGMKFADFSALEAPLIGSIATTA
jgi:Ala-tRNA(Pro) deacylase